MAEKEKFQLEFVVNASPKLLFNFLATPSGLSDWFADNVNSRGEQFPFMWDGSEETATLLTKKAGSHVKFKWDDDEDEDSFFEIRMQIDDLTGDLSLIITDFAEEDEMDEAILLWESQINKLKTVIGG